MGSSALNRRRRARSGALLLVLATLLLLVPAIPALAGPCDPPNNAIVCENSKPGSPSSEWDVSGSGDSTIQGFATDISVNRGQTVRFKISTTAAAYRIDLYRLGYYGGLGARKIATVSPSAPLPQTQPSCLSDSATGVVDCGNWSESASWAVPADAVSGVYIARLVRTDNGGASHVPFIVRDDAGNSDLLFQTSDTTWQAYNRYGGNSLYVGSPAGRAYKVSYNRPFSTRGCCAEDWVFNAEYPMIRWLEANGYNVSYFTGVDTDRRGNLLTNHKAFLSVGHDEYWSGGQRANVEAARAAGVHLAFFSGNEMFWKTRWEPSIDGSGTAHRTLVSYKETHANAVIDPADPPTWTGTWRDPRFSPPADGGRPENAVSGQIFMVNEPSTTSIQVPDTDGKMRFWRNTSVATLSPGQVVTFPNGTLGYEWDEDLDNGFRPPGVVRLSSATYDNMPVLQDYGSTYASGQATHHLTLYKHSSGALVFGAGTVQWSWGLDDNHDRAGTPVDARMRQATVNLLADMGVQPGSLQPGLVAATTSTDATAPTSTITSPASGTSVQVGTQVTVSGTAADAGGGVVGGVEVSVDGGSTWHPATGRASWSYTFTPTATGTINVLSRAADDSGNLESPGAGITLNVVTRVCPCTIWSPSTTPGTVSDPDTAAVELGVKFRTDTNGYITGIRFYKSTQNTGTHIGNLWSSTGANLASVTFTGETGSGWQEATFGTPVAVTAGTTYVASYHTNVGRYSGDVGYFASQGVNASPLIALQNGVDGPNGVYRYGAGGFPTDTYNSTNYWVDVVFNLSAADTTPPTVVSQSPAPGAAGVSPSTNVTAVFSEPVQEATISFTLRDSGSNLVTSTVTYDAPTRTATLNPDADLAPNATYGASVSGAKDLAGNQMAGPVTWSFTTGGPPPPPPNEGTGGPILVIASAANPFTRYYAEILRNEGLDAFLVTDISLVNATMLATYDVVILGEMGLTTAQVTMLTDWVNAGGNLIAMRPDKKLAGLLGLSDALLTRANAYLLVDTSQPPGQGIVGQTIQYHGTADLYLLNGARAVATIYSTPTASTSNPAVTLRSVGAGGGQAAAFAYDLARSVVYSRQGNPAWAGQERDGFSPVRAEDMFYGNAAGDPQPDWIDLNKVAIPQADEQQRLLANLIGSMNADRKPLPRFWYLPNRKKAAVVMTGDDHGNGGTAGRFDSYLAASPAGCSVANWECIRSTSYIYTSTPLTDAQAASYTTQGFEVGLHVTTGCSDFTPQSLESNFADQLAQWTGKYVSIPSPATNRTHCIPFSDWSTHPKVELSHGMRVDANYYYWPPAWIADRPGFFTAGGFPMRFADLDGTLIDVYQAPTQMTDESGQSYPATIDALLDRALGPEGYYGAFTANMHTDQVSSAGSDAIVASAKARGVPVVSARQMLSWIDARNASSFGSIAFSGNTLSFTITPGPGATGLQAMVPTVGKTGFLQSLTRDGSPVSFTTEVIKGVEHAFFPGLAGSYQAAYQADTTPPVISGVTATVADTTATITWTTNESSDSRVDYGTAPSSLSQSSSNGALVTSHSVTLTGLAFGTAYYYRVTSADAAGNAATSPAPPNPPNSFVTPPARVTDTTVANFNAGSNVTNTYVAQTSDGEVMLAPAAGAEFFGSSLPSGWFSTLWSSSGSATVGNGVLTTDAARAGTTATYGPGRSVEFVATFSGQSNQHAGFGVDLNNPPWAIFSTRGGGALSARTRVGSTQINTQLSGNLLGVPHRYRIDWNASTVVFFIDGAQVASHSITISTAMRPLASDFTVGGGTVTVDWLRMTPYPSPGTFLSRVFDGGATVNWQSASWTATLPAGTSLVISVRTGNTPIPDATWTAFSALSGPGAAIGTSARYIQYRAELSTTAAGQSPVLSDVSIFYGA